MKRQHTLPKDGPGVGAAPGRVVCGRCGLCGEPTHRVIYMGLPGRLCSDEDCGCLSGLALWAARIWFDGFFFVVGEDESYLSALVAWFRHTGEPNDEL